MQTLRILLLSLLAIALAGCGLISTPELPVEIPGNPELPSLDQLPDVLRDLGVPDLSQIPDLPQVSDLPSLNAPPDGIVFAGPTERRINVGERIPGTDIQLVAVTEEGAEFHIAGLRAMRAVGDSLDFDGAWAGISGVSYTLRMRVYLIGDGYVRAAGVHRLVVENIAPQEQPITLSGATIKVPYTGSIGVGETLKGMTLGYAGKADRGAEITGLPPGDFPYRKVGDSLTWKGYLRPDIPIAYNVRVVMYTENSLQVAGIATVQLPGP